MASKTARRAGLALATLAVAGGTLAGLAGTAQAAAPAQNHSSIVINWGDGNDEVAGVYRGYRQCQWAGLVGQRYGRWQDFDCDYTGGWNGSWQASWGQPFNRFWGGGGWHYRDVWTLRVDDCD